MRCLCVFGPFYFLKLFLFWKRKRQCEWGRGRERERERIPSRLHTTSAEPHTGPNSWNPKTTTWVETKMLNQLSHPSVPSLAHFKIRLLVFLLMGFKSSLYILDNSPLSDMSFANILSQFVACLFIHLTVSVFHRAEKNNFNEVQLIHCFFPGSWLKCCI